MSTCTYDNPSTMSRECWQEKQLICSHSAMLFLTGEIEKAPEGTLFFGANIGDWKTGRLVGDINAIGEDT